MDPSSSRHRGFSPSGSGRRHRSLSPASYNRPIRSLFRHPRHQHSHLRLASERDPSSALGHDLGQLERASFDRTAGDNSDHAGNNSGSGGNSYNVSNERSTANINDPSPLMPITSGDAELPQQQEQQQQQQQQPPSISDYQAFELHRTPIMSRRYYQRGGASAATAAADNYLSGLSQRLSRSVSPPRPGDASAPPSYLSGPDGQMEDQSALPAQPTSTFSSSNNNSNNNNNNINRSTDGPTAGLSELPSVTTTAITGPSSTATAGVSSSLAPMDDQRWPRDYFEFLNSHNPSSGLAYGTSSNDNNSRAAPATTTTTAAAAAAAAADAGQNENSVGYVPANSTREIDMGSETPISALIRRTRTQPFVQGMSRSLERNLAMNLERRRRARMASPPPPAADEAGVNPGGNANDDDPQVGATAALLQSARRLPRFANSNFSGAPAPGQMNSTASQNAAEQSSWTRERQLLEDRNRERLMGPPIRAGAGAGAGGASGYDPAEHLTLNFFDYMDPAALMNTPASTLHRFMGDHRHRHHHHHHHHHNHHHHHHPYHPYHSSPGPSTRNIQAAIKHLHNIRTTHCEEIRPTNLAQFVVDDADLVLSLKNLLPASSGCSWLFPTTVFRGSQHVTRAHLHNNNTSAAMLAHRLPALFGGSGTGAAAAAAAATATGEDSPMYSEARGESMAQNPSRVAVSTSSGRDYWAFGSDGEDDSDSGDSDDTMNEGGGGGGVWATNEQPVRRVAGFGGAGAGPAAAAAAAAAPHAQADAEKHDEDDKCERWPVRVTIHDVNWHTMKLSGTMEAYDIPDKSGAGLSSSNRHANQDASGRSSDADGNGANNNNGAGSSDNATGSNGTHIVTFLEGEVLDFEQHTFQTTNFKSDLEKDACYWHALEPFASMSSDEMTRALLSRKFISETLVPQFVLMRWKELCFVSPPHSRQGLTISGFYYISMRRSDGHITGMYYDRGSSPYQLLSLDPVNKNRMVFPACQLR